MSKLERTLFYQLLVCATVLGVLGCGGSSEHVGVAGKVTLDGAPLEGVQVLFFQPNAGPERNFVAVTDAEGNYKLNSIRQDFTGVLPGSYTVTLTTAFAGPELKETDPMPPERVPPQFREQQFDVTAEGENTANFELTSN